MKKLNILGILDGGGSKLHRIKIILEAINGKTINIEGEDREINVKFLTFPNGKIVLDESMFQDVDIVYNNWLVGNDVIDLSVWKEKLGFRFINDYDDDFNDSNHPYYNPFWQSGVVRTAIFADYITVTNHYLAGKLHQFNKNIAVIPNFIPVGEGQFIGKPQDKKYKKGDKVKIAIYGSSAHLKDWELFKPVLNRLAKNKQITENCEFVLAGVTIPSVIEMFSKKKNISYKVLQPKPVDSYMELLDEVDVICQPLVESPYNIAKSGLKILESSIKDCIFLGSQLYQYKEFNAYFKCETPLDYEKTIEFLLKADNYNEYQQKLCSENLAVNNWQQRVDFTLELLKVVMSKESQSMEGVNIYGITYDDNQTTEYIKYDNSKIRTIEQKSYLFEYNAILDLYKDFKDDEYYGVFSYKFPLKTGFYKKLLYAVLQEQSYELYDIIGLCYKLPEPYLQFTENHHPGFTKLFKLICEDLNLEVKEPKNVVYSNHFLAKGSIYKEFVNTILIPAIELLETKYKDLAWENSNYLSGLPQEKLKEVSGLDFYPFQTFILERLLSIWMTNRDDLKFKQLI